MAPGRTPSKPGTIEGNTPDLETEVAGSQRLAVHRHLILQSAVILLPLAVVPLGIPNGWCLPSEGAPAAWALLILTVMVGLAFFALATTSPTLQMWLVDEPSTRLGPVLCLCRWQCRQRVGPNRLPVGA